MNQIGLRDEASQATLAALLAHPLRAFSLSILAERTASPNEIAVENGAEVSTVSYHVKKLLESGVVELVREEKVRGAIEHFYRAKSLVLIDDDGWGRLSPAERAAYSEYTLQLAVADALRALAAGTFDARMDRALIRTPLLVDEQGWGDLADLHKEVLERTMEIKADCANRLARDPKMDPIKVKQVTLFFEEP